MRSSITSMGSQDLGSSEPNTHCASGHNRSGPSVGWLLTPRSRRTFHCCSDTLRARGPSYRPISDLHQGHSVRTSGFPLMSLFRKAFISLLASLIEFGDPSPPIHNPIENLLPGVG